MADETPFGHYVLLELLGRGGMGEVWRARDTLTERIVALKLLPPTMADDDAFKQRFRREAKVAAGLYEPHVVPIHGYGEIDGRLYVDMRLIVGRDLEQVLRDGPLAPPRAVAVIEQVAAALQAAHDVDLVHRDVKPTNIIVTASDFAYLIDFGIARAVGDTGLTNTGSTIGTWGYMAPERFGAREPDARSDVYALACVLFQCLTTRRPFPGDRVEQQVAAHMSTPPPKASAFVAGVPAALDDVVARGMAKDVTQRYQTVTQLAGAARAAVAPAFDRPAPPTHPYSEWAPAPTLAAPTWSAPPPNGAPTAWSSPPQPPGAPTPPPRPQTTKRIAAFAGAGVIAAGLTTAAVMFARDRQPEAAPPAEPPEPAAVFDGMYVAAYDNPTDLTGASAGDAPDLTWAVRSSCDDGRCVATARTLEKEGGDFDMTFDYVDGRWIGVSAETEENCGFPDNERWRSYSLTPQADGSLQGDMHVSDVQGGCAYTSDVTFRRTGDLDPDVRLDDPESLPARDTSAAASLRGTYDRLLVYEGGDRHTENFAVVTDCLRTGERCFSYMYTRDGRSEAYIFSGGKWTRDVTIHGECQGGGAQHDRITSEFSLPTPRQDPITSMRGSGTVESSGDCTGTFPFETTLTRTGD